MGRGSSGISNQRIGGGGGGTPSGVTYDQFMNMPMAQRYATVMSILDDYSIKVPSHLDNSDTTKIIYALGMNSKPDVVSDAQLDQMSGREIFRTVYEDRGMPPPSSDAILDQIRNGDFTQMSGRGGSAHGRAIYFATTYNGSALYGHGEKNPMVMRSKIKSTANIRSESSLRNQLLSDTAFQRLYYKLGSEDTKSVYALTHGIDGWYSGSYTMMVNRGALVSSSQNKSIRTSTGTYASTWSEATNK